MISKIQAWSSGGRAPVPTCAAPLRAGSFSAFSSPISTWEAAQPLLAPGGVLVYWAGERFDRATLDDLGVPSRVSTHSDLARSGPLVIMGPQ